MDSDSASKYVSLQGRNSSTLPNALELRNDLASGALDAHSVVSTCLEQVSKREPDVQAWSWLDPEYALEQARQRDAERQSDKPLGPLHGLPVGIKDIIDTAGIATENGTVLDQGRVPTTDAFVVEALKKAGAIVFGKTVTTELAFLEPSKTRNPHDKTRSPGGSSSGSAAAVASGMVPLAIGTQTGGSVIRPASFCGVTGFKPSFGHVPRVGVLNQSASLDTIGVFARTVRDTALLADALIGYHPADPSSTMQPHQKLLETATSEPPRPPMFAMVKTPFWSSADTDMQAALQGLSSALGEQCVEVQLPEAFAEAAHVRALINQVEMAKNFQRYRQSGSKQLSNIINDFMEQGDKVAACDYLSALDYSSIFNDELNTIFERVDAILTPAATGAAPDMTSTGNPVFNGLWTLCGNPAITLPLFSASDGMPMGVQLVGKRGDDGRLLRTARWLEAHASSFIR